MSAGVEDLKIAQWQQRMSRYREAGVSVAAFCRTERVSVPSFYHWRKRLAQHFARVATAKGVFTPVRLVTAPTNVPVATISVQWPGGTQLQLPVGDLRTVKAVIRMLARVDAERKGGGDAC